MSRKINSFVACLGRSKLYAPLHLKTQVSFNVCCISSNDVKKSSVHILGPFYYVWDELKHIQLLFISLLQGIFHSWVKPDLHMFGWICMISGLQRSCCCLQSESLIFTFPISLHGAPLMAQNKCWVFFFSLLLLWTLCILGSPVPFWKQFLWTVSRRQAVTEKFHGFPSPFLQPVLTYGLSAQQGKVKFAESCWT